MERKKGEKEREICWQDVITEENETLEIPLQISHSFDVGHFWHSLLIRYVQRHLKTIKA